MIAGQDSIYASAVLDKSSNEIVLKIVNTDDREQRRDLVIEGTSSLDKTATAIVLKADRLDDVNSLNEPLRIRPEERQITVKGKMVSLIIAPYSVNIIRIKN